MKIIVNIPGVKSGIKSAETRFETQNIRIFPTLWGSLK
jgi:hypothetical protein